MKQDSTNFHALSELIALASGLDGDLDNLSEEELDERLRGAGFDPASLAKTIENRLTRIRNQGEARAAEKRAGLKPRSEASAEAMRNDIQELAIAARTEELGDEEDIEVIHRLTQGEEESDGT